MVVAAERLLGRIGRDGDRVADAGLPDVLHARDDVADLARREAVARDRLGRDDAELQGLVDGLGGHHQHPLALGQPAVDHADVGDDPAVGVVDRVEDQRPGRGVGVAVRRRYQVDDLVEQLFDAHAGLGGDPEHLGRVAADDRRDLGRVALGLGGREVDLVQHRDDLEVGLEGQVEVGQRLRLDALRGVDQQHRALAGGQRAGHLVGEVDVAGGVDQVQDVVRVVLLPRAAVPPGS